MSAAFCRKPRMQSGPHWNPCFGFIWINCCVEKNVWRKSSVNGPSLTPRRPFRRDFFCFDFTGNSSVKRRPTRIDLDFLERCAGRGARNTNVHGAGGLSTRTDAVASPTKSIYDPIHHGFVVSNRSSSGRRRFFEQEQKRQICENVQRWSLLNQERLLQQGANSWGRS